MSTDLTALRKLLAESSPQPWRAFESPDADTFILSARGLRGDDVIAGPTYARKNVALIVGAINSLPDLLDALARVTAERDELERRIHRARHAAEHYAGLANVNPCPSILRALGGER